MFQKSFKVVFFHPFVVNYFTNLLAPKPSLIHILKIIHESICTDLFLFPRLVLPAVDGNKVSSYQVSSKLISYLAKDWTLCRLYVSKITDIDQYLLKLFENIKWVECFWTTVYWCAHFKQPVKIYKIFIVIIRSIHQQIEHGKIHQQAVSKARQCE